MCLFLVAWCPQLESFHWRQALDLAKASKASPAKGQPIDAIEAVKGLGCGAPQRVLVSKGVGAGLLKGDIGVTYGFVSAIYIYTEDT